jgi:hypothetical protein
VEKTILLDLANETVRRYGDLAPDFPDKMAKRIKRKFSLKIETQRIAELAHHYKTIYDFAKSILKEYLGPTTGQYSDPKDIDSKNFLAKLVKEYPNDDHEILEKISDYVVYYEYLR